MGEVEKPKYQILKEYIIGTIESKELNPGEKFLSENELAEKFSISRHTVRQAVGELVNEGWLYRLQGKGTFIDIGPVKKHNNSRTIGVITTYLNDYIFPAIIRGIDSVLSNNGYNIMLGCTYNLHEKERSCLENVDIHNIAGLIVEPTKSALPNPNLSLYRELSSSGIPILFIHGCYRELDYSYIMMDDLEAGYMATRHLISLGHKRIGGLFKVDDIQGHYRFTGFQKAHFESELQIPDSRILWFDTDRTGKELKNIISNRIIELINECTAIVCYNEQVAVVLMDVIRDKGLSVPEDISIVSFDDSQLAIASEVKMTTVAHPKEKLGRQAGEAIINMITGRQDHYDLKIRPELIIRGSTKRVDERKV